MITTAKVQPGILARFVRGSLGCVTLLLALLLQARPANSLPPDDSLLLVSAPEQPRQVSLTRTNREHSTTRSVLFRVNGRAHGHISLLFLTESPTNATPGKPGETSTETVMVPVRTVMEAIGWHVTYCSAAINRKIGIHGGDVQIVAPYELEYAHEDMGPSERGQKSHPGMFIPLFNEPSIIYSPQWNMGENRMAHPVPRLVGRQVYVPLTFLEQAVALLVRRLGEPVGDSKGQISPSQTGISLSYEEGELRLRYIPNAVERTPTDPAL